MEEVQVAELLSAARRIGENAIEGKSISFAVENAQKVPALYIDRLQIEVILRNLIANAVESVSETDSQDRQIRVFVEPTDDKHLRIVVTDNGPGVSAMHREGLFEPFVSGKSTGMGLGLAVSRAIAEAHGGLLEAPRVAHGEFHLILPCVQNA